MLLLARFSCGHDIDHYLDCDRGSAGTSRMKESGDLVRCAAELSFSFEEMRGRERGRMTWCGIATVVIMV